jgi:hypothetical protein
VPAHHRRDRRKVRRAAGRGIEDRGNLAEEVAAEDARGDDCERPGGSVPGVVEMVEAAWSERLGRKRFGQLRGLLVELNELT